MKKIYTIYKITNTVNGKCYVGYTSKQNPEERFRQHICLSKNPNYVKQNLHESMAKHGADKFTFEILFQSEDRDYTFKHKEQKLIEEHNAMGPHGYNMAKGGKGGCDIISDETRKKLSASLKGKTPWNKGLTKENDPRVGEGGRKMAETRKKRRNFVPWNKGLTKDDPRVAANGAKTRESRIKNGTYVPWNKGKKKD